MVVILLASFLVRLFGLIEIIAVVRDEAGIRAEGVLQMPCERCFSAPRAACDANENRVLVFHVTHLSFVSL